MTSGAERREVIGDVLQLEEVGQDVLVSLCPDVLPGFAVDQLRGDAHLVTRLAHAALEHVADVESFSLLRCQHCQQMIPLKALSTQTLREVSRGLLDQIHGLTQRFEDQDVFEGVGQVVLAADDVRDFQIRIVGAGCHVVGRHPVAAKQGEVLDVGGGAGLGAVDGVGEADLGDGFPGNAEADDKRLPGSGAAVAARPELDLRTRTSRLELPGHPTGWFVSLETGKQHSESAMAERLERGTIVCVLPDGGWKYLSSGAWTDDLDVVVERATRINYW